MNNHKQLISNMKIACPNCHKNYNIPDGYIQEPGRTLQCSGCHIKWFHPLTRKTDKVAKTASEQDTVKVTPPVTEMLMTNESTIDRSDAVVGQPTHTKSMCLSPWYIKSIVLGPLTTLLILANLYVARQKIVDHFPCTYSIYEKLNIPIAHPPQYTYQYKPQTPRPVSTLNEEHVIANMQTMHYQISNNKHTIII